MLHRELIGFLSGNYVKVYPAKLLDFVGLDALLMSVIGTVPSFWWKPSPRCTTARHTCQVPSTSHPTSSVGFGRTSSGRDRLIRIDKLRFAVEAMG